jgi:hypothetical protein
VRFSPNALNLDIVSSGWDKTVKVRNFDPHYASFPSFDMMHCYNICYFRGYTR